jgi:hypothetical protein
MAIDQSSITQAEAGGCHMRRQKHGGCFLLSVAVVLSLLLSALPANGQDSPRLMVGVTGSATSEGPSNPFT